MIKELQTPAGVELKEEDIMCFIQTCMQQLALDPNKDIVSAIKKSRTDKIQGREANQSSEELSVKQEESETKGPSF